MDLKDIPPDAKFVIFRVKRDSGKKWEDYDVHCAVTTPYVEPQFFATEQDLLNALQRISAPDLRSKIKIFRISELVPCLVISVKDK